jgi:hypothetical protein
MTAGAAGPVGFFEQGFAALTGHAPFAWQQRLYAEHFARGHVPPALLTAPQLFVPKSTASLTPIICKAMDKEPSCLAIAWLGLVARWRAMSLLEARGKARVI